MRSDVRAVPTLAFLRSSLAKRSLSPTWTRRLGVNATGLHQRLTLPSRFAQEEQRVFHDRWSSTNRWLVVQFFGGRGGAGCLSPSLFRRHASSCVPCARPTLTYRETLRCSQSSNVIAAVLGLEVVGHLVVARLAHAHRIAVALVCGVPTDTRKKLVSGILERREAGVPSNVMKCGVHCAQKTRPQLRQ